MTSSRKEAAIAEVYRRTEAAVERCKSEYPKAWPWLARVIVMQAAVQVDAIAATPEQAMPAEGESDCT